MKKLYDDLATRLTHDLNLEMLNTFLNSHYGEFSYKNYNNLSDINKSVQLLSWSIIYT